MEVLGAGVLLAAAVLVAAAVVVGENVVLVVGAAARSHGEHESDAGGEHHSTCTSCQRSPTCIHKMAHKPALDP
jgi:hypothetical protein